MIDRSVVEQVLVNLIGNAEKYAASGKYLCVETKGDDRYFEILVSDRGPGIPTRMREQVFKPFVRMTDRLEDPAGTGIGLTIARELARRRAWRRLRIDRITDRGKFSMYLCSIAG